MNEPPLLEEAAHDRAEEVRRLLPPLAEAVGRESPLFRRLVEALRTGDPDRLDEALAAVGRLAPEVRRRAAAPSADRRGHGA